MPEPFDKVANLYVDLVTKLEIINHTVCDKCMGTGRMTVQYKHKLPDMVMSKECDQCSGSGVVGRTVIIDDPEKQIELSLQDDERTLKIFITERVK